ncbi:MAG: glutathione S-transferase [Rhodospirillaceae bacterium]|nr:glutathione S-transferase [Rhodospirillaceae bacterium]
MKLYYFPGAPSPRKVGLFISEKGLDIPTEILNIRAGEHRTKKFAATHPGLTLPVLVLDDGACITESLAIAHYLEQENPEPNLFGLDSKEQALVLMWHDIAMFEGYLGIQERLRNSPEFGEARALPGPVPFEQIPALIKRGEKRITTFFDKVERRLSESSFLAIERYTYADLATYIYLEFAQRVTGKNLYHEREHLADWAERISKRPAVTAIAD